MFCNVISLIQKFFFWINMVSPNTVSFSWCNTKHEPCVNGHNPNDYLTQIQRKQISPWKLAAIFLPLILDINLGREGLDTNHNQILSDRFFCLTDSIKIGISPPACFDSPKLWTTLNSWRSYDCTGPKILNLWFLTLIS